MKAYIVNSAAISAQHTFEPNAEGAEWINHDGVFISAVEPNYRPFIPPALIRRMSRIVKMSLACTGKILDENTQPDAICVGTGLGCLRDSEKFLAQICESETAMLSPTSFIQSTHNTMAGQIALIGNFPCYNMTYAHGISSFDNALIDGLMHISEGKDKVLVGGGDEHLEFVQAIQQNLNCTEGGTKIGEGAGFLMLSSKPTENSVCLEDAATFSVDSPNALATELDSFLSKNNCAKSEIDGLVLGCSVKNIDGYSKQVMEGFSNIPAMAYKSISGEFNTAIAIGMERAVHWLNNQKTFSQAMITDADREVKKLLIYTASGEDTHSLYLLSKC